MNLFTRIALVRELTAAVEELVAKAAAPAGWCCDPHSPCDTDVECAATRLEERLAGQAVAVERIIRREGLSS